MTSSGPYTQSNNQTHIWSIPDLRGCLPKKVECPNSLAGIIKNHSDFTKFNYLVQLSGLQGLLNDQQSDSTLFVPSDLALEGINENLFLNMDDLTARNIICASTLNRRIPSDLIEDSPAAYFITKSPANRLFISNISGCTYINNDIEVIHKDIMATNGIIHVIDKLIMPLCV